MPPAPPALPGLGWTHAIQTAYSGHGWRPAVQTSRDQNTFRPARQRQRQQGRPRSGGDGDAAATGTVADGGAEFKDMFVSLVDPAGLMDMERCAETAGRMRRAALKSGYLAGARMSSILADIFAHMSGIAGRPVDEGALHHTTLAFSHMIGALYETAEAYRDGGDREPVGKLEEVRDAMARLATEADEFREALKHADPPGSGLPRIDVPHRGRICRDVMREDQEDIRARQKERGHDPVFPPKPMSIDEFCGDNYDPDISSADMVDAIRGKGPPEGYEVVKIENHERWQRRGADSVP